MAIPVMATQPSNSAPPICGERFSGEPANPASLTNPAHARLPVDAPVDDMVLVVCDGQPDRQLRAALATLAAQERVVVRVAPSLAAVQNILTAQNSSAGQTGGLRAVVATDGGEAAPVLDLLEILRTLGISAPLLAPPPQSPLDVAVLQDAGVEFLAGVTPERQMRSLLERLQNAQGEAPGGRRGERRAELSLDDLAAAGETMARASAQGRRALRTGLPVLVEGARGSGKFTLIRALHAAGMRRQRPLRQLDAPMLRAGLDAAIAAMGVDVERGLINDEAGGSLYLRNVDRWPAPAQAALAELLRRRGARHGRVTAASPLRIFAGSRQPLIDLVREGRFREDLYYLLSVAPLTLTPLALRPEDIPGMAQAMLERLRAGRAAPLQRDFPEAFSDAALQRLQSDAWPGNASQLRARVLRAAHAASGPVITADHVAPPRPTDALAGDAGFWLTEDMAADGGGLPPGASAGSGGQLHDILDIFDGQGDLRPLAEIEAGVIRFAVRHYRGQMSEVSRRLGIGRSTLYRKLKDLDMMPERDALTDCDAARSWPEGAAAQRS